MKILYYVIWIVCIAIAMISIGTLVGSLIGFESMGVKGCTAGAGLAVIYNRKKLFVLLDKLFRKR